MLGRPTKAQGLACLLCKASLAATDEAAIWLHPSSPACSVQVTDADGVSQDDRYEVVDDVVYEKEMPAGDVDIVDRTQNDEVPSLQLPSDWFISEDSLKRPRRRPTKKPDQVDLDWSLDLAALPSFYPYEQALEEMFAEFKVPRLGGASGDLGWSSFASFQRCPYLWYRTYLADRGKELPSGPPLALVVGSLIHALLAVHYQAKILIEYPISPEAMRGYLLTKGVSPEAVNEAWRLFTAYEFSYTQDYLVPLEVEYHVVDPKTRESCRYDLIAKIEPNTSALAPGAYVVEHKSSSRFDDATLNGWVNDGEVIGQIMLWERLKLARRFGPLQGVIVNILGKQKDPQFHRTIVSPSRWQTRQHTKDLKAWQGFRQLCVGLGQFPRARTNCINRYGKCSQWQHCATGENV